jgi:hypothetical protein
MGLRRGERDIVLKLRPMLIAGVLAAAVTAGVARPAKAALRSQFAAGYQTTSRTGHQLFRYAAATWTVPALSCPGPVASGGSDGDSYFYVALASGPFGSGYEGLPGSEQVGVHELCTGILSAYATYVVANGAYEVQGVVQPGDLISASVSYGAGKYRFTLRDRGRGQSFSFSSACGSEPFGGLPSTCGRTAARVAVGTSIPGGTLARYGAATFSDVSVIDANGYRGTLSSNRRWAVSRYDEYRGSRLLASSATLSRRGTQFTVRWRRF